MRVSITGINFKFDNGYDQERTGVELKYITSGFKIGNNDPVEITNQQYEQHETNPNGYVLHNFIVDKKIAEANAYVTDLEDYKNSLQE